MLYMQSLPKYGLAKIARGKVQWKVPFFSFSFLSLSFFWVPIFKQCKILLIFWVHILLKWNMSLGYQFYFSLKGWALLNFFNAFRLLECITGSMVEKVLEFSGFSKHVMKFVLTGLQSISLIPLENQYPMRVSRYYYYLSETSRFLVLSFFFSCWCLLEKSASL